MKYADKDFGTRFVVVSKENGCRYCNDLKTFLKHGVEGKYDDSITFVTLEGNPETYNHLVQHTGLMGLPILIDTQTEKTINGFNPGQVMGLLNG